MRLLKDIVVTPEIITVRDALWFRVQSNGGISVYMPNGLVWKKIALFGESDEGDDDIFNPREIYEGETPPSSLMKTWFDPDADESIDGDPKYPEYLTEIWEVLRELREKNDILYKLYKIGVIAGDSTTSARTMMTEAADAEKPESSESEIEDDGTKPDVSGIAFTVPAITLKCDTASNFSKNRQNLTDGEIFFYTDLHKIVVYHEGKFWGASSSGGSGGTEGGITLEDLYNLRLTHLSFTDDNEVTYKVNVDSDGKLKASPYDSSATQAGSKVQTYNVYISQYLSINTVYCGGSGGEDCLCSHNFIELANADNKDINLNGLLLLYTDGTQRSTADLGYVWHVLPLEGIIKAGNTFLIRGAACRNLNSSFIKVRDYDMEWRKDGRLMSFNQGRASFYLCVGDPGTNWVYDSSGNVMDRYSLRSPWMSDTTNVGYIDSCGFGTGSVYEGKSTLTVNADWNKVMFVRWFAFETAKQGNKAYVSRTTTGLWTYINLEKQTEALGNSVQYYYPDWMKQAFSPKASGDGKNFFTNKSEFRADCPNMLNITFGIQATSDDASGVKASRCFNWVSIGHHDEFVEWRKKGSDTWNRIYSIRENDSSNPSYISKFIEFYRRYRWCTPSGLWVTTHKVLARNLFSKGAYEYRVGRDGDLNYWSPVLSFTVTDSSDITEGFRFAQVTDQQGFNWAEYQAWKRTAECLAKTDTPLFTVNTGDITQSGNRQNEWLDYYDGRESLRHLEEMFTIGNNDLCGHDATILTNGDDKTSKYNHINVLRYFTFELDERNDYTFTWNGVFYPLYSLYSFNYGKWHFVSLNSELATPSSKTYVGFGDDNNSGDSSFASTANATIEDWFKKDIQLFRGNSEEPSDCKDVFVYMHEMPLTMVTESFMSGGSARQGSHLNTLNTKGNYRFSRIFKKYGIRLVFGGHKHTYTISKPVYDAPEGYINQNNKVSGTVDIMGNFPDVMSRKPVLQVLRDEDVLANMSDWVRYEVVDKITAPVYVMSQASGYKLVSNKELPATAKYPIPWLMSYFKPFTNASDPNSPTENRAQHYPMYIMYEVSDSGIKITAKQVQGIWNVNEQNNTAGYDMNNQITNVAARAMTLSQTSEEDMEAYGITDRESYTIQL